MAEMPDTRASFLAILALMAFSRGIRSASTRFCANEDTSTPEPAPKEVMIFCALALFSALTCAVVVVPVVDAVVLAVDVVAVVVLGVVLEMLVAMVALKRVVVCDRYQLKKLEPSVDVTEKR